MARPDRSLAGIAKRLRMSQRALNLKAAALVDGTTIEANEWSMFLNPAKYKRKITTDQVLELKDQHGGAFTLEWVFDGDKSSLSGKVISEINKLAA